MKGEGHARAISKATSLAVRGQAADAEARALIDELNALAVHPDLAYEHHWTPVELIVRDNRCLMHRASDYGPAVQRRVVRRCTVLGEVPRQ